MHSFDIVSVGNFVSLAPLTVEEARAQLPGDKPSRLIAISNERTDKNFNPSNLGQIYWFSKLILDSKCDEEKHLVLCTGHDPATITTCSLLLGGYLILVQGLSLNEVITAFSPIIPRFLCFQHPTRHQNEISVVDCWRALFSAKSFGWLDFTKDVVDIDCCIDMEEYLHYDSAVNGKIHVIVPGKLVAFKCPKNLRSELASEVKWLDNGSERTFSPAYYADVLGDFDVRLVARCSAVTYDDSVYYQAGIEVEDLPVEDGNPCLLLQRTDRFLTLSRFVPGVIAIHGNEEGLGCAELLISALLIHTYNFDARAALAWIRMLHPGVSVPGLLFSIQEDDSEGSGAAAAHSPAPSATEPRRLCGHLPLSESWRQSPAVRRRRSLLIDADCAADGTSPPPWARTGFSGTFTAKLWPSPAPGNDDDDSNDGESADLKTGGDGRSAAFAGRRASLNKMMRCHSSMPNLQVLLAAAGGNLKEPPPPTTAAAAAISRPGQRGGRFGDMCSAPPQDVFDLGMNRQARVNLA